MDTIDFIITKDSGEIIHGIGEIQECNFTTESISSPRCDKKGTPLLFIDRGYDTFIELKANLIKADDNTLLHIYPSDLMVELEQLRIVNKELERIVADYGDEKVESY